MIRYPLILKNKRFSNLYYAGLTSELGSFITETVLMLFVFAISNQDKAYLGISRAVFLLFLTLGSILGGPLGERFNRKNLMIISEFARIPLIMVLLFTHNVYSIIVINGLIAFFTGIYNPSRQALTNELIPQKSISAANSLFGSTMAILHMIGPFLGATIYAYTKGINEIIVFDIATYILGIYLLRKISYEPPVKKGVAEGEDDFNFIHELRDGFNYVRGRIELMSLLVSTLFTGLCIGILIPLVLPYVQDVLKLGEREFGIIFALFGMGGIFGGIICEKLSKKYSTGRIVVVSLCLEPLLFPLWIRTPNLYLSCLVFFIWGVVVFIRVPAQLNFISETVPTKYLTRVHALLDMAFVTPNILGGVLIAYLGNKYTTFEVLHIASIIFFLLIIPRLPFKEMKSLYRYNGPYIKRDEKNL